jgi:hypothetical protein
MLGVMTELIKAVTGRDALLSEVGSSGEGIEGAVSSAPAPDGQITSIADGLDPSGPGECPGDVHGTSPGVGPSTARFEAEHPARCGQRGHRDCGGTEGGNVVKLLGSYSPQFKSIRESEYVF